MVCNQERVMVARIRYIEVNKKTQSKAFWNFSAFTFFVFCYFCQWPKTKCELQCSVFTLFLKKILKGFLFETLTEYKQKVICICFLVTNILWKHSCIKIKINSSERISPHCATSNGAFVQVTTRELLNCWMNG